jgi:flagellar biosynthesis protein FliR
MLPAIDLTHAFDLITQHMVAMLRIGAFLMASPVFGGRFVPLPIRIMATAVLAIPVMMNAPLPSPETIGNIRFVGAIMAELAIGLVAGLVITIFFAAASIAGDRIASTAGLGFASQFDPAAGGQTPVVSQIFGLFLLSVFVGSDGHLVAMRIMLESYSTLPIGASFDPSVLITAGIDAASRMFALSAAIMLPVVCGLLMLNIVIGVTTRSAPQLNVFSFGFPITMTATMLLTYAFAPGMISSFQDLVDVVSIALVDMMGALANG